MLTPASCSLYLASFPEKITRRANTSVFRPPVFGRKIPYGNFLSRKNAPVLRLSWGKNWDLASEAIYDA